MYVFSVAVPMLAQAAPAALQRCHWYWNAVGLFAHVPFCAVSTSPTFGVPVTVGAAVFAGGAAPACAAKASDRSAATGMIAVFRPLLRMFCSPFVSTGDLCSTWRVEKRVLRRIHKVQTTEK